MKPTPPPFQIAKPCPKSWDDMSGDAKRRFCDHCQLHVHNLSEMSARERDTFVAQSGGHACIAYVLRPDGTMVTTTWRTRLAAPFRRLGYAIAAVLATLFPFAFSACVRNEPVRPLGGMMPLQNHDPKGGKPAMLLGEAPTLGRPSLPPAPPKDGKMNAPKTPKK